MRYTYNKYILKGEPFVKNDIIKGIVLVVCLTGLFFIGMGNFKQSDIFLIPEGYTGPVKITFNQEGYPALKQENGRRIYEIPSTGELMTSSKNETSPVSFYYVNANGHRTLIDNTNQVIHGIATSSVSSGDRFGNIEVYPETLEFIVGGSPSTSTGEGPGDQP